ncbi:MAG: hypothetical protein WBK76_01200 [Candidatus Saccharimonadales bacterium]
MKRVDYKSQQVPGRLEIGHTTPLRTGVWKLRRGIRDIAGKDILDVERHHVKRRKKVRHVYRKVDEFVAAFFPTLVKTTSKTIAQTRVREMIHQLDYRIVEKDETKPWGAYYRLADGQADRFIAEFFPGLSPEDARLGQPNAKLSPKFLLVSPGQRLSWQYHHRRAERWHFMLPGAYHKSMNDSQGKRIDAPAGTIVQFAEGERHRLCAFGDTDYTLVAEIWQHTVSDKASNEDDIVRLDDDYARHS